MANGSKSKFMDTGYGFLFCNLIVLFLLFVVSQFTCGKEEIPPAAEQSVKPPAEPQPSTSTAAESAEESSAPKNLEPPPPPKNVAEALQQRLEKYQHATNQAKQEGNSSKARRMGRIVKVSCRLHVGSAHRE